MLRATRGQNTPISDNSRVNEIHTYAAFIHQRLQDKNPALAERFLQELPERLQGVSDGPKKSALFKVSGRIVRDMIRSGDLKRGDYIKIRRYAFGKAQLDSDRTALSTGRIATSGSGSPLRSLLNALSITEDNSGATKEEMRIWKSFVKPRPQVEPTQQVSQISSTNAPQGFLWKPVSESDGNLVILLPSSYVGRVSNLSITSSDGSILAQGRFSGTANGFRPHFRFNKSGGSFPDGSIVQVTFLDGSKQNIQIPETSNRVE